MRQHKPKIGPGVRERMEFAATRQQRRRPSRRRACSRKTREHIVQTAMPGTILALPTAPWIAPRIDSTGAELDHFRTRVMRLTCIASLTGLPQISIPAGTMDGCPIGLSFIGWRGGDEALLDLACDAGAPLRHGGLRRICALT